MRLSFNVFLTFDVFGFYVNSVFYSYVSVLLSLTFVMVFFSFVRFLIVAAV